MTTCSDCGGACLEEELASYQETLLGLPVILKSAAIRCVCSACHQETIGFPDLDGLIAAIALARCLVPLALKSEEVTFLRKALGLMGRQFAEMIESVPETVSRWESGAQKIGSYTEKILRLKVCERLKAQAPAVDYDPARIIDMTLLEQNPRVSLPPLAFERITFKDGLLRRKSRQWDVIEGGLAP